jgi:trimethyllysine dioxygenase
MVVFGSLLPTLPKATRLIQHWHLAHIRTTPTLYVACMVIHRYSVYFYQTDPCGLQLLHLLSHTGGTGGASLLVDGFYVATIMKELHPEAYDLLSRIPIPAHAAGEPSALYRPSPPSGYPVLRHDAFTGELTQVRWNNDDRSVMDHLTSDLVEKW